jgi:hypothetical protein
MTLLRFRIEGDNLSDMEVIEFGNRGGKTGGEM